MALALSVALLLLLCFAGPALSSVDCSNETAQSAWLAANTPSSCSIALGALFGRAYTPANVAHLKTICDDKNCGQKFVDWLESEECRDQPIAVQTAVEFSRTLCASFNGSVDGTCVFSEATGRVDQTATAAILRNCAAWWLGTTQGACPPGTCASAIQTAVNRVRCCYNNFFSTNKIVDELTETFSNITGTMAVSAVNLTEPSLLTACDVLNPGICNSNLMSFTTGASLTTLASMAVAVACMLVAVTLQ